MGDHRSPGDNEGAAFTGETMRDGTKVSMLTHAGEGGGERKGLVTRAEWDSGGEDAGGWCVGQGPRGGLHVESAAA